LKLNSQLVSTSYNHILRENIRSTKFQKFLQSKGLFSQRAYPATPQQNGVAEKKNQLLDVVRTLLLESSVPSRFLVMFFPLLLI
jgi:hypothetical protein